MCFTSDALLPYFLQPRLARDPDFSEYRAYRNLTLNSDTQRADRRLRSSRIDPIGLQSWWL